MNKSRAPILILRGVLAILVLVAFALPIVVVQGELLRPGIDMGGGRQEAIQAWQRWRSLHAGLAAPLLTCALTGACLFSLVRACLADRQRIMAVAISFLVAAGLCGGALLSLSEQTGSAAPAIAITAAFLLALSAAAIGAAKGRRLELMILAAPAVAVWLWGGLLALVEASAGVDAILSDTWYPTGRAHAYGLSIILSGLTILAAGAAIAGRVHSITLNLALMVGISVAGIWMILQQLALGMQGMPARYMDYADAFSGTHASAGTAGFALLALASLAALRFLFLGRKAPGPPEMF